MSSLARRPLAAWLCLAMVLPLLQAQEPPAALSEVIDVRITSVDFIVADLQGRPVRGLTASDFEIRENGKAQEITNFYEAVGERRAAGVPAPSATGQAAPQSSRMARRVIFYFDNGSLEFANRKGIGEAAERFVSQSMRPGDQLLVATWNGSLDIVQPWTDDVAVFRGAIQKVLKASAGAAARESERKQVMRQIEEMLTDEVVGNRPGGQGSLVTFEMLMQTGRRYAESVRHDVGRQVEGMSKLLASLSGVEGRKVLLIAAEGLSAQPGAEIFQQLENVKQRMASQGPRSRIGETGRGFSPLTEMQKYDTGGILRGLGRVANAAGVTVYGMNPRGLRSFSKDSGRTEQTGLQDLNVDFAESLEGFFGLEALAAQTGGLALVGTPSIAFAKLEEDLSSYYSIGYRAKAGDSAERSIEVIARRPGLRVRSRSSSVYRSIESDMADRVIANQLQADPVNDLGISLSADPPKIDGSRRVVPLRVLVPVKNLTLLARGENLDGGFSVFICTGDGKGDVSGVNRQMHNIHWPKDALPHLIARDVTFSLEVPLEARRDQISVGVIDHVSQITGFSRLRPGS